MSLDEKVGQMVMVPAWTLRISSAAIQTLNVGAVIVEDGFLPWWVKNKTDWSDMTDHFQATAGLTRLKIPLLIGTDAVHGFNTMRGATIFPHQIGLGATRNASLVQAIAAASAKEVAGTGVRWTYAPILSICCDPRWGRCYETFAELPDIAEPLGAAATAGWQTMPPEGFSLPGSLFLSATAKHFVGDGGTTGGEDKGNAEYSQQQMDEIFLPPFKAAIEQGVGSAMASYNMWNGTRVHTSKYILTNVLRHQLGFKGMITSDDLGVQRIDSTRSFAEKVRLAVNAGIDMFMMDYGQPRFLATLKEQVLAGRIPLSRIDDAVTNILELKRSLGLFGGGRCAPREFLKYVGSQAHRELARQAVSQSLVLLKNSRTGAGGRARERSGSGGGEGGGESVFPLPVRGARVLVAGTHANDIGLQCGGWTISWQGRAGKITEGTTIFEGIAEVATREGARAVHFLPSPRSTRDWRRVDDALARADPDVAVVVVGERPYAEVYGDDNELQLSEASVRLVKRVCDASPLCVMVLISGRPLVVTEVLPHVDALVAAWLPGSEGAGVADALFDPSVEFYGKLPVTWFKSVAQLPMVHGDEGYDPLYPLGYGLKKDGNHKDASTSSS